MLKLCFAFGSAVLLGCYDVVHHTLLTSSRVIQTSTMGGTQLLRPMMGRDGGREVEVEADAGVGEMEGKTHSVRIGILAQEGKGHRRESEGLSGAMDGYDPEVTGGSTAPIPRTQSIVARINYRLGLHVEFGCWAA